MVGGMTAPLVTGTMAKILQQLEYIEKYPEHPPLQMLREKIMKSTEFKDYAEKHGMQGDENMAFRELYRDLRKSNETNKTESREGRNKKRLKERGRTPSTASAPMARPGEGRDLTPHAPNPLPLADTKDPEGLATPVAGDDLT